MMTLFLWVLSLGTVWFFLHNLFRMNLTGILLAFVMAFLISNGFQRQEASTTCDAIVKLGGRATYSDGKCIIADTAGIPVDKDNDRYVFINPAKQ